MIQITEDTPPDMLAGAMDLTVHLPNGNASKMSVERSTPMMDLLVQITTAHHLQLSNHTLQALGMAPSSEHSDKILPFKPNTPIGALDTQHIRVLPKGRTLPAPKYTAPGHQPFESTFRLKVHLPRNQLYVTRVSRNVLLEDIMKKVCEEKNLDPLKYEFKHPGNLDQVLDPKLTLSDYQLTEIYVVVRGTTNLSQAFSAADIMVLRKEEERKQMHTKTGGGVFNLIFKRGKSSMGSGSVSSDNRSISPTHSDDSRSVTPPAVQAPPIVTPPKKDPPSERPKPPQRKRRPAPRPPQIQIAEASDESKAENSSSVVSNEEPSNALSQKSSENGLTICHSRNSSDSSGYHEASILSDHCANTSLPRTRPKSAFVGDQVPLQSTSNLSKMSAHSRSTTSLVAGRKKKAAPPPPPVPVSPANSVIAQSEKPSPLVASQSDISTHKESSEVLENSLIPTINPKPKPRSRIKAPMAPSRSPSSSEILTTTITTITPEEYSFSANSSVLSSNEDLMEKVEEKLGIKEDKSKKELNRNVVEAVVKETLGGHVEDESNANETEDNWQEVEFRKPQIIGTTTISVLPQTELTNHAKHDSLEISNKNNTEFHIGKTEDQSIPPESQEESLKLASRTKSLKEEYSVEDMLASLEVVNPFNNEKETLENTKSVITENKDKLTTSYETIARAQQSMIANIFTSEEFLKESKPPEVVGVIPKTPKDDKKYMGNIGSFGKKKSIPIGRAFLDQNDDPETASISSKHSSESKSTRGSVSSALNTLDDEISDLDENMFTGSLSKGLTKKKPQLLNQLFGMHEYDSEKSLKPLNRNISVASIASLDSVGSIPGLHGARINKWDNTEELDSASLNYYAVRNRWVSGDASDTESLPSTPVQTPRESVPPFPLESRSPLRTQSEEKSLDSTDSGIAQDSHSHTDKYDEEFRFYTPPPPPILDDIQHDEVSVDEIKPLEQTIVIQKELTQETAQSNNLTSDKTDISLRLEQSTPKEPEILAKPLELSKQKPITPPSPIADPSKTLKIEKHEPATSVVITKNTQPEAEFVDIDWQYQLPSPPKAFRDSSPDHLTRNETNSVTDFKDSIITSPELFEKLRTLEDSHSDKDTIKSEVTSIASEEPLNMLSLEHLEKRKSLVYNRELATSLKTTDSLESSTKNTDNFSSSVTSFQSTNNEINKNSAHQNHPRKPARTTVTSSNNHTLPNFKITTYDVPKQNITVFEDDTIRSNTHLTSNLTRSKLGRSMDNISYVKKTFGDDSSNNTEREYKFYRPQASNFNATTVSRSESFSTDQRLPNKPVSRSKSTLTMNKPQIPKTNEANISRSNSLFDVSGLQSLEVMRLIQNKLNSPPNSMENISFSNHETPRNSVPQIVSPKIEVKETEPPKAPEPEPVEEKPKAPSPQPVKKYYYRGPPAVNMTTWSERPKVPVAVKEDEDYKLGNVNVSSKLIVNTTNNNITSNNSVEVRSNAFTNTNSYSNGSENKNISINVNGTDQISQPSNNVVIKIGGTPSNNYTKNVENSRFVGPTGYRKPFSTINRIGGSVTSTQRPHSIALPSDFDISRVPVVRSVEFKKPYKDFHGSNTSITHISHGNDDFKSLHYNNDKPDSFAEKFRSTENLRSIEKQESEPNKRVFRVSSFKPVENYSTPVIRGFKSGDRDINHRLSWNPSSTYNTLPAKPKEKEFTTNQHVPFSQSTLKRTASSKIYTADQNSNSLNNSAVTEDKSYMNKSYMEDNLFKSLPSTLAHDKPKETTVAPPPPPPPAPQMPKVTLRKVDTQVTNNQSSQMDPRDMLLNSIRNFGGKKGLRAVKV